LSVVIVTPETKNPFSLPPSGFQSKAALAAFIERPQAAGGAATRIKSALSYAK
jgi:hypothetical protein